MLKTACERFCKAGQVDAKSCAKQNNTMMCMCLNKSLLASAKASLLTYCSEYTFDGVEYGPLMYKVIMRLATIDSVATTQTLRDNLQNLGVFAVMVKGNIDKVNVEFDTNYSQLLAQGATLDDPIGILFEAYLLVPCYNFTKYISTKHDDYLDGNLTGITHQALMSMAKRKFDFLKTKGKWGAKSPDNEKIVAMTDKANSATIAAAATSAINPHFVALMAAMVMILGENTKHQQKHYRRPKPKVVRILGGRGHLSI
jgi:hypothetical protein